MKRRGFLKMLGGLLAAPAVLGPSVLLVGETGAELSGLAKLRKDLEALAKWMNRHTHNVGSIAQSPTAPQTTSAFIEPENFSLRKGMRSRYAKKSINEIYATIRVA